MPHDSDADTVEYPPLVRPRDLEPPCPLSALVKVEVGALSHPGKVRPNNEDHYLAARIGRTMDTLKTNLSEGQVPKRFEEAGYALVIADGVGGMAAGEVASSLAITVGMNLVLNNPEGAVKSLQEARRLVDQGPTRRSVYSLFVIGQARGVDVARIAHVQLAGLKRHHRRKA